MKIEFSVKRSPAKASWWLVVNGTIIETFDTKYKACELMERLQRKYA